MDGAVLEMTGNATVGGRTVSPADERALIRRAQRGDRTAFDELVRLYDRKVLHLALRVVRSPEEAKDLYQEAFLKVYRALPRFRFESAFSTWLHRVVMNACFDRLRKHKRNREMQSAVSEEGADFLDAVADERATLDPERRLQAGQIRGRIEAAVAALNPRERMVFELRHYQGLRLREIGRLCNTTEETAKNCLFRATRKMREQLGDLL